MTGLISIKTAIFLFAVLIIAACLTLKGKALALALTIVFGVAAKTLLHWVRERHAIED